MKKSPVQASNPTQDTFFVLLASGETLREPLNKAVPMNRANMQAMAQALANGEAFVSAGVEFA